jgi:methylase of polypeptide subunit release factors
MSSERPTSPSPDERPGRRSTVFGGLTIVHDDQVMEPRPWTTAQARWLAELLRSVPEGPILELCAGVGQIGLLTGALTGRDLVLVDASQDACELARENVSANRLVSVVDVRRAEIADGVGTHERFAGILADPPWVPSDQTDRFDDDPDSTIDGDEDGLGPARECLRVIDEHLAPLGVAVLQLGTQSQAAEVARMCAGEEGPRLTVAEVRSYGEEGSSGVLVQLVRR